MADSEKRSCGTCRWLSENMECRYNPPVVTKEGATKWPMPPYTSGNQQPWCRNYESFTQESIPVQPVLGSGPLEGGYGRQ